MRVGLSPPRKTSVMEDSVVEPLKAPALIKTSAVKQKGEQDKQK